MNIHKDVSKATLYIAAGVIFGLGVNTALAQWQGPTEAPPYGNVPPPIMGGSASANLSQIIEGNLVVNGAENFVIGLEVKGDAMWLPRANTTERDAISASAGMILYNTTTNTVQVYTPSGWSDL